MNAGLAFTKLGAAAAEIEAQAYRIVRGPAAIGAGPFAGGLRALVGFIRSLGISGEELRAIIRQAIALFGDGEVTFDDVLSLLESILAAIDKRESALDTNATPVGGAGLNPATIMALVNLLLDLFDRWQQHRPPKTAAA